MTKHIILFRHCRYAAIYAYKHNDDIDVLANI